MGTRPGSCLYTEKQELWPKEGEHERQKVGLGFQVHTVALGSVGYLSLEFPSSVKWGYNSYLPRERGGLDKNVNRYSLNCEALHN